MSQPYDPNQPNPYGVPQGSGPTDPYAGQSSPYGQPQADYGTQAYGTTGDYQGGNYGGGDYPPYGPTGYPGGPQGPQAGSEKNGVGLWAMILGLVGILIWLAGVVGLILGCIGLKNVKNGTANNRGQALTGVIAGAITTVLGLLGTIVLIVGVVVGLGAASKAEECSNEPGHYWSSSENTCKESTADGYGQPTQAPAAAPGGEDDQATAPAAQPAPGDDAVEAENGTAELAKGVSMSVKLSSFTASQSAQPQDIAGKQVTLATVTLKNTTSSTYKPSFPIAKCSYSGKECKAVTDFKDGELISQLSFTKEVAAGQSRTFEVAYTIPADQQKDVALEYRFVGGADGSKTLKFTFAG
jgi:hypothetical protein